LFARKPTTAALHALNNKWSIINAADVGTGLQYYILKHKTIGDLGIG